MSGDDNTSENIIKWRIPMNRKVKVLFVRPSKSSFIQKDLELLKRHFNVRVVDSAFSRENLKGSLRTLFEMIMGVLWADVTFSWFADFHAYVAVLLSKMFRKKSVVVVGGYDVANEPNINYGVMRFPESKVAERVKFVLKNANRILPFSNFAAKEVLSIDPDTSISMIPLACDTKKFTPAVDKGDIILTVCIVNKNNIVRKGLKTFVECAKYLPKVKFVLVGPHTDNAIIYLEKIAPLNVEFTGYIPDEELIKLYQKSKIYCQLSYQEGEGAGGAVGEAMACECVPIVSSKAIALQETVGDCGFYVPYRDVNSTVKAVKNVLNSSSEVGKMARNRMIELFSMEKREKRLLKLIREVSKCQKRKEY